MQYDRTVIGYHGCDEDAAERIFAGANFTPSENEWDWLGAGIYFWEYGPDRALQWAREKVQRTKKKRGGAANPAVVGALIQLGRCFDLMDTRYTADLTTAYQSWRRLQESEPAQNKGKLAYLDCAVINWFMKELERDGVSYDTVRCAFLEGPPVYEGSNIREQNHIQLAVRNPACIVGVFRPKMKGVI